MCVGSCEVWCGVVRDADSGLRNTATSKYVRFHQRHSKETAQVWLETLTKCMWCLQPCGLWRHALTLVPMLATQPRLAIGCH